MSNWSPRRLRPRHLAILRLHFQGHTIDEICTLTGYERWLVSNVINSEIAEQILQEMHAHTLDTALDIKTDAQAVAPIVMEEKIRLALGAQDERVRNTACTEILAIAGHQPVRRLEIEMPNPVAKRFEDMTEDDLRRELGVVVGESGTVH